MVDTEIKEMFGMILVKLNSLDEKVTTLDGKVTTLDGKVTTLDGKVTTLDGKVTTLDEKVTTLDEEVITLDGKVTKNSIEIDSIKSDIKLIVEVQKAHMDKNERDHEKIIELIDNQISLHSIILKNISLDVRGIKEDQKSLEREVASIKRQIG